MRKKSRRKNKRDILHIIVTLMVAFNFMFVQTLLPFSIAYAAEGEEEQQEQTEETDEEEEVEEEVEEEKIEEEIVQEDEPEETSENSEAPEVVEVPVEETPVEEQPEPDVEINAENDADVETDADSLSNTGLNETNGEGVNEEEPSEACASELEEYEKSLLEEPAESEELIPFELSEDCKKFLDEEDLEDELGINPEEEILALQKEAAVDQQLTGLEEQLTEETATEEEEAKDEEDDEDDEEGNEEKTEEELAAEEELARNARDRGEDATIDTGAADAITNIYNEINENIIGENWVDTAFNIYGIYEGDINLLEIFESLFEIIMVSGNNLVGNIPIIDLTDDPDAQPEAKEGPENEESEPRECHNQCDEFNVEINNANNATIDNDGTAVANTGLNEASGNNGNAIITTGDAFAMVNIVNVVNRNIVGENWLFVIINIFGDWTGNLIVPGADLLHLPAAMQFANLNINNNNIANVNNDVLAGADTGGNEALANGGDATIMTGDAYSEGDVTNILNTNIIGSNWFSLSINNMGSWFGGINNWYGEGDGLQYDFSADETIITGGSLTVNNTNNADVDNKAVSYANTGGNEANINGGDATIITGDAAAESNVMNFVNTNIIGSNWMFGMLNIMGTWRGDVEFAYPDLDISIDDGKSSAYSGDELKYEITVKNNGHADAEDTQVILDLSDEVSYASSSKDTQIRSGSYVWDMSGLEVGESETFTVKARVVDPLEHDGEDAVAVAQVKTKTTEKETSNNVDSDKTQTNNSDWGDYYDNHDYRYEDDIDVARVATISTPVRKGDVVFNSITVKNDSDVELYDVKLKELLKDSSGAKIVEYEWSIGDMDVGDKVLIDYSLLINGFANIGNYDFIASAKGEDPFDDEVRSGKHLMPMRVIGGFANGFYEGGDGEDDPFTLIPAAQAFGPDDTVLGANTVKTCNYIPIWMWISALAAYGLAINWSLFPFSKGTETGNGRMIALPSLATVGILAFWWIFRCDLMLWFAVAVFVILFLHLFIKERQHKSQTIPPLKPA